MKFKTKIRTQEDVERLSQVIANFICSATLAAEASDALVEELDFTNSIKFHFKSFLREMEKKTNMFSKSIYDGQSTEEQFRDAMKMYEDISKNISIMNNDQLNVLYGTTAQILEGNYAIVSDEEFSKIKK
jgi:hypothetical protein